MARERRGETYNRKIWHSIWQEFPVPTLYGQNKTFLEFPDMINNGFLTIRMAGKGWLVRKVIRQVQLHVVWWVVVVGDSRGLQARCRIIRKPIHRHDTCYKEDVR